MAQWNRIEAVIAAGILSLACFSRGDAADDVIWVEGESCSNHRMQGHPWYSQVEASSLSGGEWLSHFAEGSPPVAVFEIQVREAGEYAFWARVNPVQTKLAYRWDEHAWQQVDFSNSVQQVNIAADGQPDLRFVAWVNLGQAELAAGTHRLSFRFGVPRVNYCGITSEDSQLSTRRELRERPGSLDASE